MISLGNLSTNSHEPRKDNSGGEHYHILATNSRFDHLIQKLSLLGDQLKTWYALASLEPPPTLGFPKPNHRKDTILSPF